jgi:hypothetical protein
LALRFGRDKNCQGADEKTKSLHQEKSGKIKQKRLAVNGNRSVR